ncbi:predicted protein [Sclerotinia sclerotiorum 1980 UF-70]|uniref:Myb-like domain-containing protein n=2 Tax=Sclerotinia sclerotiorum (strain ATCC 18683 / 1980 / Ss-1) TaxID=665079 RepID=A7E624_SCLS1|nr:predicted protein [Sclerotinia sclerotiorum 1980 UF-70]APA07699.1 hypothetical protein sscle_03g024690 [Sclerotinia sclerotiorum 1980 UF-70]EDN91346.1 predicted protein [Sclerotinia sclerotiorum 1980 UF-70]
MSKPSKASKFTRADTELMRAIIEQVSRKEIGKLVDWEAIGGQLGGLKVAAVHKRWSRLNIEMRKGVVCDEAEEAGTDDSDEVKSQSGGEGNSDGDGGGDNQKTNTIKMSGGKVVAKETVGGKAVTKETEKGKAAAKKGNSKTPVNVKAITSKGKGGKVKATRDTVKAEVAADAAAKKKAAEEDADEDEDEDDEDEDN